jgi:hypothetical protein
MQYPRILLIIAFSAVLEASTPTSPLQGASGSRTVSLTCVIRIPARFFKSADASDKHEQNGSLARAHKLADHSWTCGQSNLHTSCSRRYRSDWNPDRRVTGIPYRWDGTDGVDEFDKKLTQGLAARSHSRTGALS